MSSFQQEKTKDEQVAQTPDKSQKKEFSVHVHPKQSHRPARPPVPAHPHISLPGKPITLMARQSNTFGPTLTRPWTLVTVSPRLKIFGCLSSITCAAHTSIALRIAPSSPLHLSARGIRLYLLMRYVPATPASSISTWRHAYLLMRYLPATWLLTRYLPATLYPGLPFIQFIRLSVLRLPQKMSHNAEELDAEEQRSFAAAVLILGGSLEIATVQLAWQHDFVKLWGELGKAPRADDPTLDTYTRNLILAGITVDKAWNHALDYCHPQALVALAIAIQLDPTPPGDDHPPYLVPLDFDLVAHAADTADLLLPPIANANACHQ
ncbi:hypothetical protein C8J57DRAFT_1244458 [Mycena rebaudengoi]|nr:hypothetical protein C8J57DRAFT_1244458 [Mycena rebaudengoi]